MAKLIQERGFNLMVVVVALTALLASFSAFAGTLPIEGSEIATRWDSLYMFLIWLSLFFFVLVVGAMVYFAIAYRRSKAVKTKYITGSHILEAIFIVVPTVLLLGIFVWGYTLYHDMVQPPANAYEVRVIGKQWNWTFQYDNGEVTSGELYVPANRPVKLVMTSEDVIHSFFIPSMRVKQDVVPGMYSSVWFEATVPGKHQVYCAEYCGTSHSGMLAKLIVLDDKQWHDWLAGKKLGEIPEAGKTADAGTQAQLDRAVANKPVVSLAEQGRDLYRNKGCVACHSTDGTSGSNIGPSHAGLFGKKETMADGTTVTVDENYVRESIEKPSARVVQGFNPVMPSFKGAFNEQEMNSLIAYIKSLK